MYENSILNAWEPLWNCYIERVHKKKKMTFDHLIAKRVEKFINLTAFFFQKKKKNENLENNQPFVDQLMR